MTAAPTPTVRTAVIPAAGRGSRLAPFTRAVPKELAPILARPLVDFAVEEARAAGISRLVFVTSARKSALVEHLEGLPDEFERIFVLQPEPKGLGDAVRRAAGAVGGEPFAVILPDEVAFGPRRPTERLVRLHAETGLPVVGAIEIPLRDSDRYGILRPAASPVASSFRISGMIEKPAPRDAPSRFAANGRYVFDARIFDHLDGLEPGRGGEVQLTDAIDRLAAEAPIAACVHDGPRHDCGSPEGLLAAGLALALADPDLAPRFARIFADMSFPGGAKTHA